MSRTHILTREEFFSRLESMPGMTAEMLCTVTPGYDSAELAAKRVLPQVRPIGFFTNTVERINAFQAVCLALDECCNEKLIDTDQAQLAIMLLMFWSEDFKKAVRAFRNFAWGKTLDGRHLASYTAMVYSKCCH